MSPLGIQDPFRVLLLFHDELQNVQAVPLNGLPRVPIGTGSGGTLRGRAEIAAFVRGMGFDSVVHTRQVSDVPNLAFERTFLVLPTGKILPSIESRLAARHEAEIKILDGQTITERDRAALTAFEGVILGATRLESADGFRRMTQFFEKKVVIADGGGL